MAHRFRFLIDGKICEFSDYDEIPEHFDHMIEFSPEIPPEPHTDEQHHEIDQWTEKMLKLLERENGRSGKTR